MVYEYIAGWISWVAICAFGVWAASRGVHANQRKEKPRVNVAVHVFILSMSLCLGAVALLCASYEEIAGSEQDSLLPVHPPTIPVALIAIFLGVRTVPRWGDRLARHASQDD